MIPLHSNEYNLALARSMLDEMEAYLLTEKVFWPLARASGPGGVPYPRLTLGNLLLSLDELRAQARDLSPSEAAQFRQIETDWERLRIQHQAALEHKAALEMSQRLNLWRDYLRDLEEGERGAGDFPQQARNRLILQRLDEFVSPAPADVAARLDELDVRFRTLLEGGGFTLDPRLQALYPSPTYWFLYGRPRL